MIMVGYCLDFQIVSDFGTSLPEFGIAGKPCRRAASFGQVRAAFRPARQHP
jgi:hypothetical protein